MFETKILVQSSGQLLPWGPQPPVGGLKIKVIKMPERRKLLEGDLALVQYTTAAVNIPIDGGSATTTVTASDLGLDTKIQAIVNVHITRQAPETDSVYEPQYGVNTAENAIGLTLYAGTGTSLTAVVTAIGY